MRAHWELFTGSNRPVPEHYLTLSQDAISRYLTLSMVSLPFPGPSHRCRVQGKLPVGLPSLVSIRGGVCRQRTVWFQLLSSTRWTEPETGCLH